MPWATKTPSQHQQTPAKSTSLSRYKSKTKSRHKVIRKTISHSKQPKDKFSPPKTSLHQEQCPSEVQTYPPAKKRSIRSILSVTRVIPYLKTWRIKISFRRLKSENLPMQSNTRKRVQCDLVQVDR